MKLRICMFIIFGICEALILGSTTK
uniref:Uncharacterized protein n=1 Tax=Rhizophora mucronata TaxID=61149 RepID=A0A2P2N3U5_RHIMU